MRGWKPLFQLFGTNFFGFFPAGQKWNKIFLTTKTRRNKIFFHLLGPYLLSPLNVCCRKTSLNAHFGGTKRERIFLKEGWNNFGTIFLENWGKSSLEASNPPEKRQEDSYTIRIHYQVQKITKKMIRLGMSNEISSTLH